MILKVKVKFNLQIPNLIYFYSGHSTSETIPFLLKCVYYFDLELKVIVCNWKYCTLSIYWVKNKFFVLKLTSNDLESEDQAVV